MPKVIGISVPLYPEHKVHVHGLSYAVVPQNLPNILSVAEEILCRQVSGCSYLGASEFLNNKLVLLGGLSSNSTCLYHNV